MEDVQYTNGLDKAVCPLGMTNLHQAGNIPNVEFDGISFSSTTYTSMGSRLPRRETRKFDQYLRFSAGVKLALLG